MSQIIWILLVIALFVIGFFAGWQYFKFRAGKVTGAVITGVTLF